MANEDKSVSIGDAARAFLATLPPEEREASQQEINRFARWYGIDRPLAGLAGPEVASYADEQLTSSDTDYQRKIEMLRAFLAHAKNLGARLIAAVGNPARNAAAHRAGAHACHDYQRKHEVDQSFAHFLLL